MEILQAFNDIEKLEARLSELYRHFSSLFSDDPPVALLFQKLSDEEQSHYNLIQYQKRLVRKNKELFKEVAVDVEQIRQLIAKLQPLMESASVTAAEAIQSAIQFETSASECHYRTAMQQANPEFSAFLKNLGGFDDKHAAGLREFAASHASKH